MLPNQQRNSIIRYAFHKVYNTNLQHTEPHPIVHGSFFQAFAWWPGVAVLWITGKGTQKYRLLQLQQCTWHLHELLHEDSVLLDCDTVSLGLQFRVFPFKMSGTASPVAQHDIPEDLKLKQHCCENIVTCTNYCMFVLVTRHHSLWLC